MAGVVVGVHLLDGGAHLLGQAGAGFDDHHHFVAALDRALPPIVRDHAGQDVDAGAQPALDQGLPGPLRLDNGWKGRIDENRAFHVHSPAAAVAPRRQVYTPSLPTMPKRPAAPRYKRIAFVASAGPRRSRRGAGSRAATAMRGRRPPT